MYDLKVINAMNEKACEKVEEKKKEPGFGHVCWDIDDLENALEVHGIPVTEENIEKLYNEVNTHWFTDYMIEQGWEYIYQSIYNLGLNKEG